MGKRYNTKIKRGRKIYNTRFSRYTPAGIIFTVVIVGALFAAGWFLYTPVYNLVTGQYTVEKPAEEKPVEKTPEVKQEEKAEASTSTETEEPAKVAVGVKAYYIPNSIVSVSSQLDSQLDSIDKANVNSVVVDIKTEDGIILYDTANEKAKTGKVVAANPFNLEEVAKKIDDKGFTPIARISAFKDPIGKQVDYTMAVKYSNTDISWLDKAPEYGGKSWINPYSSAGQSYIEGIVKEALDAGFKKIILTNVQFPNGYSMETATYPESAGKSKQQVLGGFVKKVTDVAKSAGADLYVYIEAPKALGMDTMIYDGNPLDFVGDNIVLGVMPSLLGNQFKNEAFSIDNPVINPYETVKGLLDAVKADGKNIIPMLQGYTAEEYKGSKNYAVYGEKEIEDQIKACKDSGIENYIIYKP